MIAQPCDDRDVRVEQRRQRADDARLRLAALAEEHHVMAGEDGVLDLRDDRVVEADDAGQDALAAASLRQQVAPHLSRTGRTWYPLRLSSPSVLARCIGDHLSTY